MIAADTSALIAIALDEPDAADCMAELAREAGLLSSAGTLVDALIAAARRSVKAELDRLIDGLALQLVPVTAADSRRIATACNR